MRRFDLLLSIYLILCIPVVSSCDQQPLNIGLMVDLTGRASGIGISGRNGAEMAVEEINQNGGIKGRKLRLIVKDDRGIPSEAAKVDRDLLDEGILLGIGHFASGTGIAGLKVFNDAGKLMISPTISSESLSGKDDCLIRIIDSNRRQGEILAEAAGKTGRNKKVAMVYEKNNIPYTEEVCKYFKQAFTGLGGSVVLEKTFESSPEMDFGSIADAIAESGADGTLIVAGGLDLAVITQKLKQKSPNIEVYAGMWAMTDDLLENGGKAVEGIYMPGVYDRNSTSPEFISFRERYLEIYKEEPTFSSVYAYESVFLVRDALMKCKSYDTASIKKSILEIKRFDGLEADYSIDGFGDTNRGYQLFRVDQSGFGRVKG